MSERKPTKTKEPKKSGAIATLIPPQPITGLTVDQVAQRLQLNRMTVIRLLQSGALHGIKVGRPWRVHPDALYQFLMQRAETAPLPPVAERIPEREKGRKTTAKSRK